MLQAPAEELRTSQVSHTLELETGGGWRRLVADSRRTAVPPGEATSLGLPSSGKLLLCQVGPGGSFCAYIFLLNRNAALPQLLSVPG